MGDEYDGAVLECSNCGKTFVAKKISSAAEIARKKAAREKVFGTIKLLIFLAVLVGGGIWGYKYFSKSKAEKNNAASSGEKTVEVSKEQEPENIKKLTDLLSEQESKLLGKGLEKNIIRRHMSGRGYYRYRRGSYYYTSDNSDKSDEEKRYDGWQEAIDKRLANANAFLASVNQVFKAEKLEKLPHEVERDFKWLVVFLRSDSWSLINDLKIKEKLLSAESCSEFREILCSAVKKYPKKDKLKAVESYWGKDWRDMVEWRQRIVHLRYMKNLRQKFSYIRKKIYEIREEAFEDNIEHFLVNDYNKFIENIFLYLDNDDHIKDLQVYQNFLSQKKINLNQENMNGMYGYSDLITNYDATRKEIIENIDFVFDNSEILTGLRPYELDKELAAKINSLIQWIQNKPVIKNIKLIYLPENEMY